MKTRDMILVSLFAALTTIGAFLKINIGAVPFTFHFLFVAFAGVFLGARNGLLSQIVYIAVGLLGIPVFSNGGGITYVFSPTFGYLLGFAACSFVVGYLTERMDSLNFAKIFGAIVVGLAVTYLIGVPYMYMIIKLYLGKSAFTFQGAIASGLTPFIIPDLIKAFIATSVSLIVLPRLRAAGFIEAR